MKHSDFVSQQLNMFIFPFSISLNEMLLIEKLMICFE